MRTTAIAACIIASSAALAASLDARDLKAIEALIRREFENRPGVIVLAVSLTKTGDQEAIGFAKYRNADGESLVVNCFVAPKAPGRFSWKCDP